MKGFNSGGRQFPIYPRAVLYPNNVVVTQGTAQTQDRVGDKTLVFIVMLKLFAFGLFRGEGEVQARAAFVGMGKMAADITHAIILAEASFHGLTGILQANHAWGESAIQTFLNGTHAICETLEEIPSVILDCGCHARNATASPSFANALVAWPPK
jgi:hypothetical protein